MSLLVGMLGYLPCGCSFVYLFYIFNKGAIVYAYFPFIYLADLCRKGEIENECIIIRYFRATYA